MAFRYAEIGFQVTDKRSARKRDDCLKVVLHFETELLLVHSGGRKKHRLDSRLKPRGVKVANRFVINVEGLTRE